MNDLNQLHDHIREWAKERGIDTADPTKQMLKLYEEVGELSAGLAKSQPDKIIDGIGDTFVVLTILAQQLGPDIKTCAQAAYDEIKERKGQTINGVFVKQADIPATKEHSMEHEYFDEIHEIGALEADLIIGTQRPYGKYWTEVGPNKYVAIDNSTGDAWTEEFTDKDTMMGWLNDRFEMSEFEEFKLAQARKKQELKPR